MAWPVKELRVDHLEVTVRFGVWVGNRKVDEYAPAAPLRLFAADDAEAEPYGRALEALLARLTAQIGVPGEGASEPEASLQHPPITGMARD